MTLDNELKHLHRLASISLPLWGIPEDATLQLLNVSENTTFLVVTHDQKLVLRVHRDGYHTRRAIECELAWLTALGGHCEVKTPNPITGLNGDPVQQGTVAELTSPRFMVIFEFIEGDAPRETGDLSPGFESLGRLAAQCHEHVLHWEKPHPFNRLTWDVDAVLGANPTWGDWRDAPNVTPEISRILERVEQTIRTRLNRFGKAYDRYNLIHADMRLANLLVNGSETRLIDFDDCGFGWFLYDFAAAISFIEDDPRVPEMKAAWLEGYRSLRNISKLEEDEIDTFIMLRRMALLAWIGSHIEAPEPQALAPGFAANTAKLGDAWLTRQT